VSPSVGPLVLPRNALETALARCCGSVLRLQEVSVEADFFKQLGGDSLRAAQLVTMLRQDPSTAWVTVRDIYESRTMAALALKAPSMEASAPRPELPEKDRLQGRPVLVTTLQALWLVATFSVAAWAVYLLSFIFLPWLAGQLGLVAFIFVIPLLGILSFTLYTPLALAFAVLLKRLLIGRYQSLRAPVWGSFYLRNWIVKQAVKLIPWHALEGTSFQLMALRALGAKIGQQVHIHRGVNLLQGGWDLLEIGNNVTLSQEAALHLVELDDGDIVIGPVTLGDGATLDIRAVVSGHTTVETNGYLTALSSLSTGGRIPQGERWDGIPARFLDRAPPAETLPEGAQVLSSAKFSLAMVLGRSALLLLLALPLEILTVVVCLLQDRPADNTLEWFHHAAAAWTLEMGLAIAVIGVPLTLVFEALLMRLLGRVPEGSISCRSLAYIRVWLKTGMLESAGKWLSGTLFWPVWLRAAGMKVGPGCEISTIIDVVPEHIEIGASTFFADGIYLGGPRLHRGVVTLRKTRFGQNTFLGNHVVIPAGQCLPDDILLGVCTVANDAVIRQGTSWFGLPPFELPRRELVEMDRSLTHEPSWIRYWNRVFWEALRFALPILPLCVLAVWIQLQATATFAMIPLISFGAVSFLCGFILALKWVLLGKVRPGQHALWSCWCSRWDFLYVAWGQYASSLVMLEGTLLLNWYLRAMGMKVGKRVVLGSGFAQVVDPDMIHIEDGATVNASYQAHTFEDRVLKIDHVYVRRWATLGSNSVPLYGADIGEGTHVATHSVIMKGEHLLPGLRYEGAPSVPKLGRV
jgi:non-ribosomal peptide synthetase-like protein